MSKAIEHLRQLPFHVEFTAVLLVAFGLFSLASFEAFVVLLFPGPMDPAPAPLRSADLYALVRYELFALALILPLLAVRGWNFRTFDLRPTAARTIAGLALFCLVWNSFPLLVALLSPSFPDALGGGAPLAAEDLSLASILALSTTNAVFEEVLVVGYVVAALRERKGVWYAINVSVALRTFYHLYQGAAGVLTIVPMGLLFAWVYARYGRLWPLVVAHFLLDLVPLLMLRG